MEIVPCPFLVSIVLCLRPAVRTRHFGLCFLVCAVFTTMVSNGDAPPPLFFTISMPHIPGKLVSHIICSATWPERSKCLLSQHSTARVAEKSCFSNIKQDLRPNIESSMHQDSSWVMGRTPCRSTWMHHRWHLSCSNNDEARLDVAQMQWRSFLGVWQHYCSHQQKL
jgi:hypothetical protein